MMSEKQYRVARKGIIDQIKLAQKLHCTNLAQKHKASLKKLELRAFYNQMQQVVLIGEHGYRVVIITYN